MPLNPARPDLTGRLRRASEEMRQQRTRPRGHTESKTFIVGGAFTSTIVIPKFWVGLDPDDETPEFKHLFGFGVEIEDGTATIQWQLNGVDIGDPMSASTTPETQTLTPRVELAHADRIQPVVTASSSASGLSATAFIITGP